MNRQQTIHPKYLPISLGKLWPQALVVWLFLDRIGIAPWGWGVYWTITGILTVAVASIAWKQDKYPPQFGPKEPEESA